MKKRFLGLFAILAMFCIALVGCGGGGQDYTANFSGEWELSHVENNDELSPEAIQDLRDLGLTVNLSLGEDGAASLVMFGEDYGTGEWKATGADTCEVTINDEALSCTLDDSGLLHVTEADETLVFMRTE